MRHVDDDPDAVRRGASLPDAMVRRPCVMSEQAREHLIGPVHADNRRDSQRPSTIRDGPCVRATGNVVACASAVRVCRCARAGSRSNLRDGNRGIAPARWHVMEPFPPMTFLMMVVLAACLVGAYMLLRRTGSNGNGNAGRECGHCGHKNPRLAKYCGHCGAKRG